MDCPKCGEKNKKGAHFCNSCGHELIKTRSKSTNEALKDGSVVDFKTLKCSECGSSMQLDGEKDILCCPYCGSKKIIIESDYVRLEKYKISNDKEIKLERMKYGERRHRRKLLEMVLPMTIAFVAMIAVCIVLAYNDHIERQDIQSRGAVVVKSSYSNGDLAGHNYEDVQDMLEQDGFENVQLLSTETNFFTKEKAGMVKEVTIDGEKVSKGNVYGSDEVVVVKYYEME